MIKLTFAVVACAASLFSSSSAFAEPSTIRFIQGIVAQCPAMVAKLVSRQEMATTLRALPINVPAVCTCTGAALEGDSRLTEQLQGTLDQINERISSEQFSSYLLLRLSHSVFVCLAPELEASLNAATLPK